MLLVFVKWDCALAFRHPPFPLRVGIVIVGDASAVGPSLLLPGGLSGTFGARFRSSASLELRNLCFGPPNSKPRTKPDSTVFLGRAGNSAKVRRRTLRLEPSSGLELPRRKLQAQRLGVTDGGVREGHYKSPSEISDCRFWSGYKCGRLWTSQPRISPLLLDNDLLSHRCRHAERGRRAGPQARHLSRPSALRKLLSFYSPRLVRKKEATRLRPR